MRPDDTLPPHRAALSALMDGDASASDEALRAWRSNPAARADWHAYHLIGDLLRSDEHRCDASHDLSFVAGLRDRLAAEPGPLAPTSGATPTAAPMPARARRHGSWMAPAAVAAGFVAVAGALGVMRVAAPDAGLGDRNALAGSIAQGTGVKAVGLRAGNAPASAVVALPDSGTLVRNAELDRYLAAHRQYGNASALAVPGGVVRSATVAAPGR